MSLRYMARKEKIGEIAGCELPVGTGHRREAEVQTFVRALTWVPACNAD